MLCEYNQSAIVDRLMQIVTAESVTILTKNGPVEDEVTADKNSLTAAKSLCVAHLEFLKRGGRHSRFMRVGRRVQNREVACALFERARDRETVRSGARDVYAPVRLTIRHQNAILDRLIQIVSKQTVTIQTKNGSVADEVAADKNSIAAAKFLIALQAKFGKYSTEDADIVQLNAHYQKVIVERLMQILAKRSVIRQTKYGPFEDEVIADQNAIRAAKVLISYNNLEISSREGEIPGAPGRRRGRGGDRETEMLLRASIASESRRAGGVKTPSREGETEMLLRASVNELETGKPIGPCEPDQIPSELGFTAEDVVREALKIVARDTPGAARESSGLKVESRRRCARAIEQVNRRAVGTGITRPSRDVKVERRKRAAKNFEKIA